MNTKLYDALIIGAGAAGMMAALEIALTGRSVAIVEAKDRTGGRMHTINQPLFEKPVELGAEFVHGDLPITLRLFEKAGIKKQVSAGEVWKFTNGKLEEQKDFMENYDELVKKFKSIKEDMSVADLMEQYLAGSKYEELRLSLKNYVQGYYAGDIKKASTYALYKELTGGEDEAYRVEGGYQGLAAYLEKQCREKGVQFYLSEEVQEITWQPLHVKVKTDKQTIPAKKILLTVSIGVLQSETIAFSPALPQKSAAIKELGFGHVVKVILQFGEVFWQKEKFTNQKNLAKLNFLFSEEPVPTWWTQHLQKEAMLVGWLGGPPAEGFTMTAKEVVVQAAIKSLAQIFSLDISVIQQKLVASEWYNWSGDNHFCGSYSYMVVNGEALIKEVLAPVDNTLYFAGEGLHSGNEIGTVEAALASGRDVAHQLIAQFNLLIEEP